MSTTGQLSAEVGVGIFVLGAPSLNTLELQEVRDQCVQQ